MKAEEYLKSKRLKNPPLDSGISGGGDAPRIRVSDMMNEYAKYQSKRMYSEEELKEAFRHGQDNMEYSEIFRWDYKLTEKQWFEQFKKK